MLQMLYNVKICEAVCPPIFSPNLVVSNFYPSDETPLSLDNFCVVVVVAKSIACFLRGTWSQKTTSFRTHFADNAIHPLHIHKQKPKIG